MRKDVLASLLAFGSIMSGGAAERSDSIKIGKLEEVVVTGSNAAVGRNLIPYTVSVISGNQLQSSGDTQLLSALSAMVPSLFVTQRNIIGFGVSSGGAGHIKMRGVGGDRASGLLMMVDGQPQFAGLYSHHVADFYQTQYVDRVEVLRGPASVLYGSNAMAGVINVITKEARQDGINTILSSKYGSRNTWLSSITNTMRFGKFSSLLSAGYNRTDGVKKDFDFNQENVYAKAGYDFSGRWNAKADYTFMAFSANDPVYPTLKGNEGVYHQRVIRGEASVTATDTYDKCNGAIRLYYSYGNHFIHDPEYFHSLDDRFGIIAYQNFMPWKEASATLGFDFDRYSGKIPVSGGATISQNPMATMSRRHITEYSPYITLSQSFCNRLLSLNMGLRMANSDMFATQWVPQGGVVCSPGKGWTAKASVAKGYRNPSFRELYLYKFANPDLQPESMINYEIGVEKHFNRYFLCSLTGYFSKGTNLIQQTATLNENTGSFINKGIELSAQSNPLETLHLWASYSYLHTSVKNLTGAPRNQYYIGIGWDCHKGVHIDAELKGTEGLYVADDVKIQDFALLNIRVSWQVIRQLQLFLNLDNITDTQYIINKGYPMPRFTAMGGFRLSI